MTSLNFVSMNIVTLLYLIASVCFIQALKGLSNPKSARAGNVFGMSGMAIAILLLLYHSMLFGVIDTQKIGQILIYVAAVLTLWSMAYYLKMAIPLVLGEGE